MKEVEKANTRDIDELVDLRLAYLTEDHGALDEKEAGIIRSGLPGYFEEHLDKDLHIFVIREEDRIVSCAFLLLIEKPMSPSFLNGRTGTVLNVYTCPDSRRKGYAGMIMDSLTAEAERLHLSRLDLKSTQDGYDLYRSAGFEEDRSGYRLMEWHNREMA